MASDTQEPQETQQPNEGLLTGLSMIGGIGITLIVVALAYGVVIETADSGLIGMLVLGGFGALVIAIGGWVAVTQPHRNFDDINQPMYHGHHHADDESDDH